MLIEPASKVSVPLVVVMRTRSNVPDVVLPPLKKQIAGVAPLLLMQELRPDHTPAGALAGP